VIGLVLARRGLDAGHGDLLGAGAGRARPGGAETLATLSGKVLRAADVRAVPGGCARAPCDATITDPEVLRREIEPVTFCGYADIVDELEEGLARMSVAIGERGSRPVATLKVTGPSLRFGGERIAALRPMRAAVAQIRAGWKKTIRTTGLTPTAEPFTIKS
jgi:Bacterial transcriptional regulator